MAARVRWWIPRFLALCERDMSSAQRVAAKSSPWREPIVWLMIALVSLSVIGSIALLRLATADGPVDSVADPVRRTGQAQMADLEPDARAAAEGLSAIVRVDDEWLEVLPVNGDFDRAAPLDLSLNHPSRAAEDRRLRLIPSANGWRYVGALPLDHDWRLQLAPSDGAWRLRGRLPKGQRAAHLGPSVEHAESAVGSAPR